MASTLPMPEIETSLAFDVAQVRRALSPLVIVVEFAANEPMAGAGVAATLTVTLLVVGSPSPLATSVYVVLPFGLTCRDPLGETGPMPSMVTSVAPCVLHFNSVD